MPKFEILRPVGANSLNRFPLSENGFKIFSSLIITFLSFGVAIFSQCEQCFQTDQNENKV